MEFRRLGIDFEKRPFAWQRVKALSEIRNCIAHDDGWVTDHREASLRALGIKAKKDSFLSLRKGDFLSALKFVERTCNQVLMESQKRYPVIG